MAERALRRVGEEPADLIGKTRGHFDVGLQGPGKDVVFGRFRHMGMVSGDPHAAAR